MIYDNILQTIGDTPIVKLNRTGPDHVDLYVKLEAFNPLASVKDRLAYAIIKDATDSGALKPGQTVVEATSGNTGIALAMVCAAIEKTSYTRLGGFAECTAPNSRKAFHTEIYLKQLSTDVHRDKIHGVWMGFLKVSASGAKQLQELLPKLLAHPENKKAGMSTLFQELLNNNQPIRVLYTVGHWLDINNLEDLVQAGNF